MASSGDRDGRDQPGLEVVSHGQMWHSPHEAAGLQPVGGYGDADKYPVQGYGDGDKMPVAAGYGVNDKMPVASGYAELPQDRQDTPEFTPPAEAKKRKKRFWVIIGGVLLVFVIVGAVVGGVVGSRSGKKSSEDGGDGDSSSDDTGSLVRRGSSLAVTGWVTSGGVETLLFFQDREYNIRRSRYTSGSSAAGSSWSAPDHYGSVDNATAGTQMAAALIIHSGPDPQSELFYSSSEKSLLGLALPGDINQPPGVDSVVQKKIATRADSGVGAYWPWIALQAADGRLFEVRNQVNAAQQAMSEWEYQALPGLGGVAAAGGTRLALVPASTNFTRVNRGSRFAVFFQASDGRLGYNVQAGSPWPTDFPSIELGDGGSFSAFAVARPGDGDEQRTDVHVVYYDSDSSGFLVVSAVGGSSLWTRSSPEVLSAADADSGIACLTLGTTHQDPSGEEVLLPEASAANATRCYFQRSGLLREVRFDGSEWTAGANITF
ncbi:hypothetical protein CSOJ01_04539 [Colletotrichum sojae]|uniref:Fucose-specific lectin n=1 Tax=Colletotrichum sojae TaxID=2175907 RepID=A0A8H6JID2_9PEZI|nr:hypothetical protein CSOJ01_04539 [Colletotrichum sojae]